MKKIFSLIVGGCILMFVGLSSCKDDTTAEEAFLKKVSGQWTASTVGVTVDGVAVNGVFAGFSLTISEDGSYTTVNGNTPIWPTTGSLNPLKSSSSVGFDLQRNDGVDITVEQLADQVLILSFQYTDPNGRTSSVSGNYVFDLERIP